MIDEIKKIPGMIRIMDVDYVGEVHTMLYGMLNKQHVYIVASAENYNIGLTVKHLLQYHCRKHVDVIPITEFQFWYPDYVESESFIILITGHVSPHYLSPIFRVAKKSNCDIYTITNSLDKTISENSNWIMRLSHDESGIVSTRNTIFILLFFMLVIREATNGLIEVNLDQISNTINNILNNQNIIKTVADNMINTKNICILGSGIHYPVTLDLALRLKTSAGIHAEGYTAGEFRHGSLALIDDSMTCVIIHPSDQTYQSVSNVLSQIRSRGDMDIVGIANHSDDKYTHHIPIPYTGEFESVIYELIISQLLSYHIAEKKKFYILTK